ncbi:MAG: MgtC/SapB family protein [Clostridia bacterium]|nr:MgtC/SapB family protein [Clostridia bacterium]
MDAFYDFVDYMRELNICTVTVRLVLALIIGGLIGLERGKQGRAAGMRTHILVSIGATLTAMIGFFVRDVIGITGTDPMRVAAQVISGIGFLGMGTILLKGRFQITGLTTAAGLWATAAIGLALGAGFYEAAFITSALILLTVTILHRLEYRITKRYNRFGIYAEIRSVDDVRRAIDTISSLYSITDVQVTSPRSGISSNVGIEANVHIHGKTRVTPTEVSHTLEALDFIVYAIESV